MDITTVVNLLVIGIFGLVFSIFVMLIRGTARVRREGPPEETSPSSGTRPPTTAELDEKIESQDKRLSTLIRILHGKGTLTDDDEDELTK
jgi:hypothetical protein